MTKNNSCYYSLFTNNVFSPDKSGSKISFSQKIDLKYISKRNTGTITTAALRKTKSGMNREFEAMYRENSKYVYNVALGILRNPSDAEDIVQNVFVKLFNTYDSFRGDSSIRTYLYRMTVNKCLDLFRLRKIHDSKLEKIEIREQKNHAAGNEIYDMLDKLPINLKAPILLSEIGDFSYREISEILGINFGTVKSRLHRGMERLRDVAKRELSNEKAEGRLTAKTVD